MLAFDTETTDLLKPEATELCLQPFIIEIYIAKFNHDFEIIDEFETFVKPPLPIPEHITKINGITDEMVKNAPSFVQIFDDLCDFVLGEKTIFAHNASFDLCMFEVEMRRMGTATQFPWPPNQICTVEASFPINNKRMKLGDLHKLATGTELLNAHRAKNDVLGMIRCIKWLKEKELV